MTYGESLLRAILDDPASDAARLVYADWLEKSGETARAEFIRVQVELAKMPPTLPCPTPAWPTVANRPVCHPYPRILETGILPLIFNPVFRIDLLTRKQRGNNVETVTLTVPWNWIYYAAITVGILVYLFAGLAVATLLLRLDRAMPTEVGFISAVAWPLALIVLVSCVIAWVFDRILRRLAGREEGDS